MTNKRQNRYIRGSQAGFTLVELLVTMIIFVLAITAASQMFVGLLTQFKQQSKVAESNIEGVIGLELLRADLEQAGFGLPWNMNAVVYSEAAADLATFWTNPDTRITYNDVSNPPRAFVIGNGEGMNGSDILVVKATNVATNDAAPKWTYVSDNNGVFTIQTWGSAQEDLANTDYVIGLMPTSGGNKRVLINGGVKFTGAPAGMTAGLEPVAGTFQSNLVYGIKPGTDNIPPRMPFNRADYYIRTPAAGMPTRCAPGTGVLYKATVNHADGLHTEMPLLDCVLDMQVIVVADTGTIAAPVPTAWDTGLPVGITAETLRNQVRDVRVYIVAHEGQRDPSFTYNNPANKSAGPCFAPATLDNQVCINDSSGAPVIPVTVPDLNYRWKLYTLVVAPYNLR